MINHHSSPLSIEEKLAAAMYTPAPVPEFVEALHARLMRQADIPTPRAEGFAPRRKALWGAAALLLVLLTLLIVLTGPQKVLAEITRWLGYIPGLGLVEQNTPVRVLEKPVRLTRDGISVSVNSALLSAAQTRIEYGISGVPLSAYPAGEHNSGCLESPYLLLPDGTRLPVNAAVTFPPEVNEADFVLPCLPGALPNAAPTGWHLPLHFIPLPAETGVLPVIELSPTPPAANSPGAGPSAASTPQDSTAISFEKYIETGDGYILIGWFHPALKNNQRLQLTAARLRDAAGKNVDILPAEDIDLSYSGPSFGFGDFKFAYRIKAVGLTFPLELQFSGMLYDLVPGTAAIDFDAGDNPQPGQEWNLNQDISIGQTTVRLLSIQADTDGYSFNFEGDPHLDGPDIQVEGFQAVGGGGGSHNKSLFFASMPTGRLKLIFSNLYKKSGSPAWSASWQPDVLRSQWPTPTASASAACYTQETLKNIPDLPAGLDGWMLRTELNPRMQLVLSGMHTPSASGSATGSPQPLTIPDANRGALTLDGQWLAYINESGLNIVDTINGKSTLLLPGLQGYGPRWSPDGQHIAYISTGGEAGIWMMDRNGGKTQRLSNLGYESIAGWSPDGSRIYFAVPDAGNQGFMLRAVDISTNQAIDQFILEDSSRKEPLPVVSPDGQWVVYRASDNNSLYIKGMDGSPARLLLDKPALAITGLVWEKESHLLGVSLINPADSQDETLLIQIDNCETYRLPYIHGELNGIYIP